MEGSGNGSHMFCVLWLSGGQGWGAQLVQGGGEGHKHLHYGELGLVKGKVVAW